MCGWKVWLVPHPKANSAPPREVGAKKIHIGGHVAKAAANNGMPGQKKSVLGMLYTPNINAPSCFT